MAAAQSTPTGEEQRAQQLLAMGFSATQALLLAATQHAGEQVDLDRLRWMLQSGCAHQLVMRIVI